MYTLSTLLTTQTSSPDTALDWSRSSGIGQFFNVVWIVVVFCAVLAMAYFFTKRLASARTGAWGRGKTNLRLVESCGVGMQSYVHIVKAGKKYMLIGVAKSGVSFLAELDREDLENRDENPSNILPFEKMLRQYLPRLKAGAERQQGSKGDDGG